MRLPDLDIGSLFAWLRNGVRRRSVVPPRSAENAIALDQSGSIVKDGDVLLWRGTYAISKLFEWASMSWYSHAAFILYWKGRPMVLQAGPFGVQAVPFQETLRKYHGLVDWYPLTDESRQSLDLPAIIRKATDELGRPFAVLSALRELVYRWTSFRFVTKRSKHRSGLFCAEYVSKCFKSGGLDILPHTADIHTFPDDISRSASFQSPKTVYDATRTGSVWTFAQPAMEDQRRQRSVPTLPFESGVSGPTTPPGEDAPRDMDGP